MYVDLSLENRPLKDVIEKKLWSQAEKRDVVLFVHEEHGLSVSKACTALRISRSMFLYKPTPRDGSLVITTLLELVERYPRYGFAKYFVVLRREGYTWNHKRVYRIYRQLQLNMRRKGKGRLPSRNLPDGLYNTGLTLSSLNQASPRKTHMWSGSTAPSARRYWTSMFLAGWVRFAPSLTHGYKNTTSKGHTNHWAISHQKSLPSNMPGAPV